LASHVESQLHPENAAGQLFWEKLPSHRFDPFRAGTFDLIGISAQINTLEPLRTMYRQIRSIDSDVPVVIGNLLGIYAGEHLLQEFPDALVCTGEGEPTLTELLKVTRELRSRAEWSRVLGQVPGIAFCDHGLLRRNPTSLLDLAAIPRPRRDFVAELLAKNGIVRVEASRGCHWGRCEFCSVSSRFGLGGYRRFPPERVVADLVHLGRLGVRSPYFSDEDFFGRRYSESAELAECVLKAKNSGLLPSDMSFFVSVLSSDVVCPQGREALLAWKRAGLREVFIGVEAGSEAEIRRFSKKANSNTNTNALHTLQRLGFQVDIGFIMFDPRMTLEDLKANVDWLKAQNLQEVDSRLTKRLRVQPQTDMQNSYSSTIVGTLQVDELSFPYVFQDERVARVEALFRRWESETKDLVYAFLASARGEVGDESLRLKRKRMLASLRQIDLAYLDAGLSIRDSQMEDMGEVGNRLNREKLRLVTEGY
jgi:radical SAM superfamily enzyme YgiQ (UPF0313 family)